MASPTCAAPRRNPLTLFSLLVLIAIEVYGVALAGGWALAGLFELGDAIGYIFMAAFSAFGTYLMIQLWRRAAVAEE